MASRGRVAPTGREPDGSDEDQRAAYWARVNSDRWHQALEVEKQSPIVLCDSDPLKLHYSWCLARIGAIRWSRFQRELRYVRDALAAAQLGFADMVLISIPPLQVLNRHKATDTTRQRRSFDLHAKLGEPLREWYSAVELAEPGRVVVLAATGVRPPRVRGPNAAIGAARPRRSTPARSQANLTGHRRSLSVAPATKQDLIDLISLEIRNETARLRYDGGDATGAGGTPPGSRTRKHRPPGASPQLRRCLECQSRRRRRRRQSNPCHTTDRATRFERSAGRKPCLAPVLVGDDPASHTYVRMKTNRCRTTGLDSQRHHLPDNPSTTEAVELVGELASDHTVDGILCSTRSRPTSTSGPRSRRSPRQGRRRRHRRIVRRHGVGHPGSRPAPRPASSGCSTPTPSTCAGSARS